MHAIDARRDAVLAGVGVEARCRLRRETTHRATRSGTRRCPAGDACRRSTTLPACSPHRPQLEGGEEFIGSSPPARENPSGRARSPIRAPGVARAHSSPASSTARAALTIR
jgi:hypothetical protein